MKINTERALRAATTDRDVLHRIAWAAAFDPALRRAAMGVLNELEAAETEVALLKLEAACKAASSAEQVMLPVRERPHLITEPYGVIVKPSVMPGGIIGPLYDSGLRVVGE